MSKIKLNYKFIVSFIITLIAVLLVVFVFLRGIFASNYLKRADEALAAGDNEAAISNYNIALFWNGKNQAAYLSLTQAYMNIEDFDNAHATIDKAISKKVITDESGMEVLYIQKIKVYSTQGQLAQAAEYTDSITDLNISRQIAQLRPGELAYTPTQGSYDRSQKIVITVPENESVYFTTDGSSPTRSSSLYSEPISIGKGETIINAISVNEQGLVSPLLTLTYNIENANEVISFDDRKVEQMVLNALKKSNDIVYARELESITELTNEGVSGKITTLSDLGYMPNLTTLILTGENAVTSLAEISNKKKLAELNLSGCQLSDSAVTALSGLTELTTLNLSNNNISSVSGLRELTKLQNLDLSNNKISDITPLTSLTALKNLNLGKNSLADIRGLEACKEITVLDITSNTISELPTIHSMEQLIELHLGDNPIKNLKNLEGLTNLVTLDVSDCEIVSLDFVSKMSQLINLNISDTNIATLSPLSGLKLKELYLSGCPVSNISPILSMTELYRLDISETKVYDIADIKSLTSLEYLDISGLDLQSVAAVKELVNLKTLRITGVNAADLDSIARAGLTIEK